MSNSYKVQGMRAHDTTARFALWPTSPSLTPIHNHLPWSQAFRLLTKDGLTIPQAEAELRTALAVYDSEVADGAITLPQVPDYYSQQYNYERYPARVAGRAGHFCVWSRNVARPNPEHVTWSPETVAIVAEHYRNEAWYAERAEQAARINVNVGDHVKLGDLIVEVPKRAAEYVDGVPCKVVEQ